jgi:hypothetical protein
MTTIQDDIDSLTGKDEPLFWYWDFGAGPMICDPDLPSALPLYASPQPPVQRQPMTDEEMFRLITRTFESVEHVDRESLSCALVRAVERFHKIGDEA